jgi:MFS family permease
MECIALATAPLIAGAIADVTSWRVCFWISVPLGSIPIISVLLFLRLPETDKQGASSSLSKLRQLDPVGMALFVPLIICFTLALQTGGTEYPWNSKQVILPLAMTGALLAAFGVQQAYMQEQATLPARLLRSRIMLSSIAVSFACSGALYVFTYYVSEKSSSFSVKKLIFSSSPFIIRRFVTFQRWSRG